MLRFGPDQSNYGEKLVAHSTPSARFLFAALAPHSVNEQTNSGRSAGGTGQIWRQIAASRSPPRRVLGLDGKARPRSPEQTRCARYAISSARPHRHGVQGTPSLQRVLLMSSTVTLGQSAGGYVEMRDAVERNLEPWGAPWSSHIRSLLFTFGHHARPYVCSLLFTLGHHARPCDSGMTQVDGDTDLSEVVGPIASLSADSQEESTSMQPQEAPRGGVDDRYEVDAKLTMPHKGVHCRAVMVACTGSLSSCTV